MSAVELGKVMGKGNCSSKHRKNWISFVNSTRTPRSITVTENSEKVKELTDGRGADVIYDPVGKIFLTKSCRCINWNGRLLVIGFTSGRIPEYKANLALLKGSSMVGVFLGRFRKEEPKTYEQNLDELLTMYANGQ